MICIFFRRCRKSLLADGAQVDAVVEDFAAGRFDQPQDRPAGRRFAAAGFADEAQRLAGVDVEADVVDRVHVVDHAGEDAAADREIDLQILYVQQRLGPFGDGLAYPDRADPASHGWPIAASSTSDAAGGRGPARPIA